MRFYGPAIWLDYYDTHAIICAWYYTLCCIQYTWNKTAKWISLHAPKYALKYTPDCTWLYTPSLFDLRSQVHLRARSQVRSRPCWNGCSQLYSMVHSQPASLYTPKLQLKTFPSTPPSMLPSTPPSMLPNTPPSMLPSTHHSMLSRMVLFALDGTLPGCLTVRTQLISQDALNCTRWHTPSLLDCIPKYALKTLPIALDGTLLACFLQGCLDPNNQYNIDSI
jgi:hypothetical protein